MNYHYPPTRPAEILLVEDDEADVILTRKAFKNANIPVNLSHVENGEQCLAFLRKEREYANAPTPDLVLLDLNMPRMDGRQVMTELVSDDRLKHLPVVILTTSGDERDVLDMYKLRCSAYITKPVDINKFQDIVDKLNLFWFTIAVLPPYPAEEGTGV